MTNQIFETEPATRAPAQSLVAERNLRFSELRALAAHRITDPGLLRNVRRATGLAKRCFDFAVAALAIVFLSPALLTIALLIKIFDPGPVFYGHRRLGRQGAAFDCLKFRTMKVNAQEELRQILASDPAAAAEWEQTQKLRNDPRVTKLGAFLRKTSLDELPQLWNVFRGDMSLVGPRPMLPQQRALYPGRAYYRMRPGLTGPWQVSDRNAGSFAGRAEFDTEYHRSMSLLTDLTILVMTCWVVLRGTGY